MFLVGIVVTVAAYLLGSLSAAMIVSKKLGMPDPHSYGSGNPGATNMLRSGRKDAAAWTLAGDALKGLLAVVLARCFASWLGMEPGVVAWAAIAVVAGHMWPLFYGFRGGKGVATALGVLLGMSFSVTVLVVGVWAVVALKFKKSSLAALVAAVVAPWAMFVIDRANHRPSWGWALVVIAALVIYRHRSNIKRLCSGEEHAFGTQPFRPHTNTYNPNAGGSAYQPAPAASAVAAAAAQSQTGGAAVQTETQTAAAGAAAQTVKQPEQEAAPETAAEEAVDTSAADLRDGDALEEAVIAEAAKEIQAAAEQETAEAETAEGDTVLVQVETQPELRFADEAADKETETETEQADKPKRGRKPRKNGNKTE